MCGCRCRHVVVQGVHTLLQLVYHRLLGACLLRSGCDVGLCPLQRLPQRVHLAALRLRGIHLSLCHPHLLLQRRSTLVGGPAVLIQLRRLQCQARELRPAYPLRAACGRRRLHDQSCRDRCDRRAIGVAISGARGGHRLRFMGALHGSNGRHGGRRLTETWLWARERG